jgi:hypothetical protein
MKIQILANDDKVLETIDKAEEYLKTQHGMGQLLEKILGAYRNKYSAYMWEQYQMDRRSGDERRHLDETDQRK